MAYNAIKISPLDLKPSTGIGVGIPFNGPAVFNTLYTTKDQIKSNIINFFLTNQGERFMNPQFGSNLRKKLFELITAGEIDEIKNFVEYSLSTYFKNIKIINVTVSEQLNTNSIFISVSYSVPSTNIQDEITLNFNG